MNPKLILLGFSLTECMVLGQVQPAAFTDGQPLPEAGGGVQPVGGDISAAAAKPILIERDANHEVLLSVEVKTNEAGALMKTTNTTTVLGSGLFYKDASNQWVRSAPSIAITGEGTAESRGTHHKVTFLPDVADSPTGAVHLVFENKHISTRLLGIAYYDYHSEKSVLVAELTNAPGFLVSSNEILYRSALTDFKCDLRYRLTAEGVEQDCLLREVPTLPEKIPGGDFSPATTRVQIWSEIFTDEKPQITKAIRRGWKYATVDRGISFGEMALAQGVAFNIEDADGKRHGVPTDRQYVEMDGRKFIVEEIGWRWLIPLLRRLPQHQQASLRPVPGSARHLVWDGTLKLPKQKFASTPSKSTPILAMSMPREPGCVLDWNIVHITSGMTFRAGQTYLFDSNAITYLSGTTVFEGNTCLKYRYGATLEIDGPVTCLSGPYRPIIMTSSFDRSVGNQTDTGTLSGPQDCTALFLTSEADLKYLDIRYVNWGIYSVVNYRVTHSRFGHVTRALHSEFSSFNARNCLFYDTGTNFVGSYYHGIGQNITCDQYAQLDDSPSLDYEVDLGCEGIMTGSTNTSSLEFVNSLFSGGGDLGPVPITSSYSPGQLPGEILYQPMGGGYHYLTNGSPHRDAGTTAIDADLLADLRQMTTYPPALLESITITSNCLFNPSIPRDTNTVDIGYHYSPIDILMHNVAVTNTVTTTIAPGTVVAGFSTNIMDRMLSVSSGAHLAATGTPTSPVWIVDHNTVQSENPTGWTSDVYSVLTDDRLSDSAPPPGAFDFRFTRFSAISTNVPILGIFASPLTLRDCQFHGASAYGLAQVAVTNCLFDGSLLGFDQLSNAPAIVQNATFHFGELLARMMGAINLTVSDTVFEQTLIDCSTNIQAGNHNAYLTNCPMLQTNATDVMLTNAAFVIGPLGNFYYPTSGGGLARLINAGSTNANLLGLYHFTTTTNFVGAVEQKETNSIVDIGFHFVAANSAGSPIDSDGNGLPDYLQDISGLGSRYVLITSPSDNTSLSQPANVALQAAVCDWTGTVTNLVFFRSDTPVGSTVAPYRYTWPVVPSGNYSLTAVSFNDNGLLLTSPPVSLIITNLCGSY